MKFGREENEWREYTRVWWSAENCLPIDVFMVNNQVRRTGSDGLALMQYHAIMAGNSKFVNISLTLFIRVVHRNHFTLHRQIIR